MRFFVAAAIATICLTSVAAMAFEPMTATIRVMNGSLNDSVIIGEHPEATDGYDNAYDAVSPANISAAEGKPFISVVVSHPDWKPDMRELQRDIRSLAKSQEWQIMISSSLPKGTLLNVAMKKKESTLPQGMKLTLKGDMIDKEHDLGKWSYMIEAPGPGVTTRLLVTAEQP